MEPNQTEILETDWGSFECSGKLVIFRIKENAHLDIESFKSIEKNRPKLMEQGNYIYCVDARNKYSMTKEYRKLVVERILSNCLAVAILTGSNKFNIVVANFMLRVDKVKIPFKMFNSESGALNWLREHIN